MTSPCNSRKDMDVRVNWPVTNTTATLVARPHCEVGLFNSLRFWRPCPPRSVSRQFFLAVTLLLHGSLGHDASFHHVTTNTVRGPSLLDVLHSLATRHLLVLGQSPLLCHVRMSRLFVIRRPKHPLSGRPGTSRVGSGLPSLTTPGPASR